MMKVVGLMNFESWLIYKVIQVSYSDEFLHNFILCEYNWNTIEKKDVEFNRKQKP